MARALSRPVRSRRLAPSIRAIRGRSSGARFHGVKSLSPFRPSGSCANQKLRQVQPATAPCRDWFRWRRGIRVRRLRSLFPWRQSEPEPSADAGVESAIVRRLGLEPCLCHRRRWTELRDRTRPDQLASFPVLGIEFDGAFERGADFFRPGPRRKEIRRGRPSRHRCGPARDGRGCSAGSRLRGAFARGNAAVPLFDHVISAAEQVVGFGVGRELGESAARRV